MIYRLTQILSHTEHTENIFISHRIHRIHRIFISHRIHRIHRKVYDLPDG